MCHIEYEVGTLAVDGGLLHLVERRGDWAGPQPTQAPPRCTKCNIPPINDHVPITVLLYTPNGALLCSFFLVTWLSLRSISAVVYQILSKSDDFSLRYGDLAMFKMAAVHHLGFVMTSQYCIAGQIFVVQILSWNFLSIGVVVSEILAIS